MISEGADLLIKGKALPLLAGIGELVILVILVVIVFLFFLFILKLLTPYINPLNFPNYVIP